MNATSNDLNPKTSNTGRGTPFKEMSRKKKMMFVLRVLACMITFGFIFTDVLND